MKAELPSGFEILGVGAKASERDTNAPRIDLESLTGNFSRETGWQSLESSQRFCLGASSVVTEVHKAEKERAENPTIQIRALNGNTKKRRPS